MLFSTLFAAVGLLTGVSVSAAPLQSRGVPTGEFSGKVTYYNTGEPGENDGFTPDAGACEEPISDHEMTVAISTSMFDKSLCGKQVQITNPKTGKTMTATVKDSCAGCAYDALDLTTSLFDIMSEGDGGSDIGEFNTGNGHSLVWRFLEGGDGGSPPPPTPPKVDQPEDKPKPEESSSSTKPDWEQPTTPAPPPEAPSDPAPETTSAPAPGPSSNDWDNNRDKEHGADGAPSDPSSASATGPPPTTSTSPVKPPPSTWVSSLSSASSGTVSLTSQLSGTQVPPQAINATTTATAKATATASITGTRAAVVPGAPPAAHAAVVSSSSLVPESQLAQSNIYALQQLIVRFGQAIIFAASGSA